MTDSQLRGRQPLTAETELRGLLGDGRLTRAQIDDLLRRLYTEHDEQQSRTCDASSSAAPLDADWEPVGPCILRRDHDGPVHQAADGTAWYALPEATHAEAR